MKCQIFVALCLMGIITACKKEDTKVLALDPVCDTVLQSPYLLLPTAFSPNGDGKNDLYRPVYKGIQSTGFELKVQKLDGQSVFYTTNKDAVWDGKYQGVISDDYLYQVHVKARDSVNNNYNLCTYLILTPTINGCVRIKDGDLAKLFFEDQINPQSMQYEYNTGESLCLFE